MLMLSNDCWVYPMFQHFKRRSELSSRSSRVRYEIKLHYMSGHQINITHTFCLKIMILCVGSVAIYASCDLNKSRIQILNAFWSGSNLTTLKHKTRTLSQFLSLYTSQFVYVEIRSIITHNSWIMNLSFPFWKLNFM